MQNGLIAGPEQLAKQPAVEPSKTEEAVLQNSLSGADKWCVLFTPLGGGDMKKISFLLSVALLAAGCASKSTDIEASYVSPMLYQNLTCEQLALEAARVSQHAAQVSGAQDKKSRNDAVAVGVAIVLFWPAVFLAKGDGATASEVARLKGEMEAIESASIQKGCNMTFEKSGA